MNALTHLNLVKCIGFVGVLVAGLSTALPARAELETQSETGAPNLVSPVPVNATEIPSTERDVEQISETEITSEQTTPGATSSDIVPGMSAPNLAPTQMPAQAPVQTPAQTPVQTPTQTPTQTPAQTPSVSTPNPETPGVAANTGTIVDIASASGSFQTLVAALTEAELAEVLSGEGPFTVFAPTDAAFEALPDGTVDELLKPENRDRLVEILTYHVVPGSYPASSLAAGQVETASGDAVTIRTNEGQVMVNDATVIQPDIAATNGVIHVIDRVMLPPSQ